MNFSYTDYKLLLDILKKSEYDFVSYFDRPKNERCVILRHDIDYDINKAVEMAGIEAECGAKSTYFVLLTTDFYNVFSRNSINSLRKISSYGHDIGLHFDEMNYPDECGDSELIKRRILQEAKVLSEVLEIPIKTVSMHRPSKQILEADIEIPGMINSYSKVFFRDFKYLSDSRRRWRESVEEIVKSKQFNELHILTHAFWYNDEEISLRDTLNAFINNAGKERYRILSDNFTNLDEALGEE